jgi:tetratricopeptide (TPR) repeat protein
MGTMVLLAILTVAPKPGRASDKPAEPTQVRIQGFAAGCTLELDAAPVGKTSTQGEVVVLDIEPGDHYLHADCPGQAMQSFFISPKPAEHIAVKPKTPAAQPSPLEAAEARQELTELTQKAVAARGAGHADEAIADLRRATQLDPENPDLHQELGITFLLMKDWERARVEYLEAIKHDPTEGASHNGLGYALEKLGEILPAVNEFRLAVRLDPDDSTYQEHYIEALAILQDEKERAKKKKY